MARRRLLVKANYISKSNVRRLHKSKSKEYSTKLTRYHRHKVTKKATKIRKIAKKLILFIGRLLTELIIDFIKHSIGLSNLYDYIIQLMK